MMVQDLARFGTVFAIFVMGFSQAYFIIFLTFKPEEGCDPDENDDCVLRFLINKIYTVCCQKMRQFEDLLHRVILRQLLILV